MKIVINKCWGGFGLSEAAYKFLGLKWDNYGHAEKYNAKRNHPKLVKCVETLGERANGAHARLDVVEIPDGVKYEIDDYDGMETIHEKHRTWG